MSSYILPVDMGAEHIEFFIYILIVIGVSFLYIPAELIFYFAIYSFLGWCTEVTYAYYEQKKFVNRGFLHGPVCPIYGFGVMMVVSFLKGVNNIFSLFLLSSIITSVLEYFTALALEYAFKCKWWDYTGRFMNIKGRICLEFSLIWGVICVFIIECIQPIVAFIVNGMVHLPQDFPNIIATTLFLFLWTDFVVTVSSIYDFRHLMKTLKETTIKYETIIKNKVGDSSYINEINKLKKELEIKKQVIYSSVTRDHKRILKAFPALKLKNFDPIHDIIKDIKKNIGFNK